MKNRGKIDDTLAAMFSNVEYRDSYLFYAHMVGQCSVVIDKGLPACAGVLFMHDHYKLIINPDMFDILPLQERLGIIKHEMLHILYNHLDRMEDRVHKPWNFATDCALNQHINPDHLPDWVVTPKTLGEILNVQLPENENSEFYYDKIKENAPKLPKDEEGEGEEGGEGGEGGQGDGKGDEKQGSGSGSGNDKDPFKRGSHDTWKQSEGDSELQKDLTKKMIQRAEEETIKSAGKVPSECSEWLQLHSRKNEVNWKKVLRGIVGNKRTNKRSTIMRKDRRFPHRSDLRGKTKDRMFNLLLISDVSGSMSDKAVLQTWAEVQHICDMTKTDIDLIQIDTVAYPPEKLSKKTKKLSRKGNGGTVLYPALEMAKKHNIDYQAVVVLTDGGLWGDEINHFKEINKKVIWLIESNGSIMNEMNTGKMQAFKLKNVE